MSERLSHRVEESCDCVACLDTKALAKQLAALPPAMTWTTEKPTKPGWYWHRAIEQRPARLVFVRLGGNVCDVMQMRTDGEFAWPERMTGTPRLMGGEWAGPLEPPQ